MRLVRSRAASDGPPDSPASVDWSRYDFADFGCSDGGSLLHCRKRFQAGEGLGVDADPKKVEHARQRGLHAIACDLHDLQGSGRVRFVSMMQFLEHLPSLGEVERVIVKAADLATDFLYIHHPSFEEEHYLLSNGLRLYYHDWHGHPTHVTCNDFFEIFERNDLLQYFVRPVRPIYDSLSPVVIPSSAPQDQHDYDEAQHGPKPRLRFPRPIFQHIEIFLALRPFEPKEWKALVAG